MTWSSDNGSITFYGNNLPKFVYKDANNTSHFHYGPDRNRWRHTYKANGTDFNTIYVQNLFEKVTDSGSGKVTFKNYIRAGGIMVAMRARDSWGGDNTTYLHGDHLGSVSNYTDGGGSSLVAASYDAFGDRRGTNWTGDPTSGDLATMNNLTRRGFTEHEMLDSSALIHMNGRVYNPVAGRFVSADPYLDCGLGTQGWNRYSYTGNRTLSATDPTGFGCEVLSFVEVNYRTDWYTFSDLNGRNWDIFIRVVVVCTPDDPMPVPEPEPTPQPVPEPAPLVPTGSGGGGGCGPDILPQFSGNFGLWDFGPACRAHDACYNSCGGRHECDAAFAGALYSECSQVFWRAVDVLNADFLSAGAFAAACHASATAFSIAVITAGGLRYPTRCGEPGL